MAISIDQIKKLREETGAPIADIKRALESSGGNEEKAKEALIKSGFERADKKAARQTKAGRVFSYIHHSGTVGAIITLLCETDFVARTDEFQNLGREIAMQVASMNPESKEELLNQDYIRDAGKKIETLIKEVIAKTGENIQLKDFKRLNA